MLNDAIDSSLEENESDDLEARLARCIQNAFKALEEAQAAAEMKNYAESFELYDNGIAFLQKAEQLKRRLGDVESAQLLAAKAAEYHSARADAKAQLRGKQGTTGGGVADLVPVADVPPPPLPSSSSAALPAPASPSIRRLKKATSAIDPEQPNYENHNGERREGRQTFAESGRV